MLVPSAFPTNGLAETSDDEFQQTDCKIGQLPCRTQPVFQAVAERHEHLHRRHWLSLSSKATTALRWRNELRGYYSRRLTTVCSLSSETSGKLSIVCLMRRSRIVTRRSPASKRLARGGTRGGARTNDGVPEGGREGVGREGQVVPSAPSERSKY